jgi:hypothetical protein
MEVQWITAYKRFYYVVMVLQCLTLEELESNKHYDLFYSNTLNLYTPNGVGCTDTSSGFSGEGIGVSVPSTLFIDSNRIVVTPHVNINKGSGIRIQCILFIN